MEGSHSPFGIIWEIAKATGWSMHYIMWRVNYQTLIMMVSDGVRYVQDGEQETKKGGSALGFFQTKLKKRKKRP
ncbi:MAG: hypothetical protein ACRCUJ_14315 [Phocaeicola sp.]